MNSPLLLRDVELEGVGGCWVFCDHGRIEAIGAAGTPPPRRSGTVVVDGAGGALLRGLHDHHCHLFASVAAAASIPCGPPRVTGDGSLGEVLKAAAAAVGPGDWLRGAGYDEYVVGVRTASELDALMGDLADRPTRISHRSGHAWLLNTSARALLGLAPDGGLLIDADDLIRERLGREFPPLAPLSTRLAGNGVTGLTDAGAHNSVAEFEAIVAAVERGDLQQRTLVLGAMSLPTADRGLVRTGALKLVLSESDPIPLDELVQLITRAGPRGVALHTVSRTTLVLAAAALARVGMPGQRLEHASVAPPEIVDLVRQARARVVTQPAFVHRHGERYLRSVGSTDRPWLYRLRGWLEAGVPLAAGSDAPYGPWDPWLSMRTAVNRRTADGQVLGEGEALTPEEALGLFQAPAQAPGDRSLSLTVGDPADLCLLALPWIQAREELAADLVCATVVAGRIVYSTSSGAP